MQEEKLDQFIGRFVQDLGAVAHAATVVLGDRLGLYRAMGDGEPTTPRRLAEKTGCDERYLREWLAAQAASGYVEYDEDAGTFRLPEEQAFTLASEDNPVFVPGGLQVAGAALKDVDLVAEAFRTGNGVAWGDHDADLFAGTCRFFRANYIGNLLDSWIPALEGVDEKLRAGAGVADVGCGYGASTRLMASAYPDSTFVGFDSHGPSIDAAEKAAADAGLTNCRFEVATAKDYPGTGYDLVTVFDALHDMGDPAGAAAHACRSLAADGTWMVVEPYAGDDLSENLTPIGRIFYSASTMICTPNSRSQEVDEALGAQAGEGRLREIATRGGFGRVRRAAETPFNLVLEARP
ncbi:class I SAM-dependent methyltransferase [Actinomycetospora cinnamomea]|uniref:Methyltransferase family protein n=1 Tax=Actinomycetospora cinnamomea TaxID=663609 RepID=A0A2U1F049_9PSEU|nr:class I SAM-dependent methyltransferase [Actinomycetospora cinnamomea]PVZ05380.1 methyltransferase family protein [Actinomycetospora cinnamomea]